MLTNAENIFLKATFYQNKFQKFPFILEPGGYMFWKKSDSVIPW